MEPRYFTAEEATAALSELRPLVERMVGHRRALVAAESRRAELATSIAGNGGGIDPRELSEATAAVAQEAAALALCVEEIHRQGALVKDLDLGLVDFPARLAGEDVLLCWKLGEDEVAHWHGTEEGFAGRRPLD